MAEEGYDRTSLLSYCACLPPFAIRIYVLLKLTAHALYHVIFRG